MAKNNEFNNYFNIIKNKQNLALINATRNVALLQCKPTRTFQNFSIVFLRNHVYLYATFVMFMSLKLQQAGQNIRKKVGCMNVKSRNAVCFIRTSLSLSPSNAWLHLEKSSTNKRLNVIYQIPHDNLDSGGFLCQYQPENMLRRTDKCWFESCALMAFSNCGNLINIYIQWDTFSFVKPGSYLRWR